MEIIKVVPQKWQIGKVEIRAWEKGENGAFPRKLVPTGRFYFRNIGYYNHGKIEIVDNMVFKTNMKLIRTTSTRAVDYAEFEDEDGVYRFKVTHDRNKILTEALEGKRKVHPGGYIEATLTFYSTGSAVYCKLCED
jgi:hypothetical protein